MSDFMEIVSNVNLFAVLVAAIASIVLGALWYSPLLFVNAWMQENGFTKDSMKGRNPLASMITAFLLNIVMAFIMAIPLTIMNTFSDGLIVGSTVGIGFVAISFGITYIFENKSLRLFLINGGYNALNLIVMGGIIGAWK